ncbi:hypothetical protein M426DRAFT_325797 [Hypoxylon sp. CI-4A]|nr:hypothetical protein M426DRAFT_325797 [Hypoxylon sp. CI-4A]
MPIIGSGSSRHRLQSASERNRASSTRTLQDDDDEPASLPPYEPLSTPLNDQAVRALNQLSSNKDTRKYEEQLKKSIDLLSNSVRDLNDKYAERKESLKRLQEKRGPDGEKTERERAEEKAVLALQSEVPRLTDECDQAVRSVVDLRVELEDGNAALRETAQKVETEAQTQRQRRRDEEEDDENMEDLEITGPIGLLQDAMGKAAAVHVSKSLYEKYGLDNDYIGFKQMWHDAVHGNESKPLPDATRWFTEDGGYGEADDDDLIVAEEHLDVRCPLSMVVMQDPYTSSKCKHTFEKASIVQFLRGQPGQRARCPQTGCNKEVSIDDFRPDPVMFRRIKRQQQASQHANDDDEDDDDDEDNGDEDVDEDMDVDGDSHTDGRNIKTEREGRGRGRELLESLGMDEEE